MTTFGRSGPTTSVNTLQKADNSEPLNGRNVTINKSKSFCQTVFSFPRSMFIATILLICIMAIIYDVATPDNSDFWSISTKPKKMENSGCGLEVSPGDCDPDDCPYGICESRYIRYWDSISNVDRTKKFCQCVETPMCSLVGMKIHSGCRNYASLSEIGQDMIKEWSMTGLEKRYNRLLRRKSREAVKNEEKKRAIKASPFIAIRSVTRSYQDFNLSNIMYDDKTRHQQIFDGNSKFCCRRAKSKKLQFSSELYSSTSTKLLTNYLQIISLFYSLFLYLN